MLVPEKYEEEVTEWYYNQMKFHKKDGLQFSDLKGDKFKIWNGVGKQWAEILDTRKILIGMIGRRGKKIAFYTLANSN